MVNQRGGRSFSSTAKSLSRRSSSFLNITLYIILLFAFSIFIFLFNTRDILDNEQKPAFVEVSDSESESVSHHESQSSEVPTYSLVLFLLFACFISYDCPETVLICVFINNCLFSRWTVVYWRCSQLHFI